MGCRPTQRLGPEDRLKRSSEALLEKLDQRATQDGMKWGRRRADKLGRRRTGLKKDKKDWNLELPGP